MDIPQRTSLYSLWFGLGRYLIAFEPQTFVLDQREHPWQMLSLQSVLLRSKNFTSNVAIRMPPPVSIYHYFRSLKPTKWDRSPIPLFHAKIFKAIT
uniref:Uncharacterized protein n=1 Tax=Oryza brachyantha TaxID=4533 RepID=J3KVJ4_ORYBR